jgi:hypothetical protein
MPPYKLLLVYIPLLFQLVKNAVMVQQLGNSFTFPQVVDAAREE